MKKKQKNKKKPKMTISSGRVHANIWQNKTKNDKTFLNIELYRIYKDNEDNYKKTYSFSNKDALDIAHVCKIIHGQTATKITIPKKTNKGE